MTAAIIEHPPCVICDGEVAQKKPSESLRHWRDRPTCGTVCGYEYQRRKHAHLMVEAARDREPCRCGRSILPRSGESRSRYLARLYCSQQCGRAAMCEKRWGPGAIAPLRKSKPMIPAQSVEEFLASGGRIRVIPAAYVAKSIQGALPLAEELRRIKMLRPPPEARRWRSGSNSFLFGKPAFSGAKP